MALFVSLFLTTRAQQIPLYSQMYFMRMLYNPALTGYNGETNLYGFYRNQWTGMPGNPVTAGAMGEISLWKDRSGLGFHVYSDNTDIIHRINAQVYYAQKIHIAKDHILSLGFSLGILDAYIDYRNAKPSDVGDPHLLLSGQSGVAFDMNVGIAYQWKKLTVGFSVPQIINTRAKILHELNSSDFSNKRHFIGSVSYEISIAKEKFNIEPCVIVKNGSSKPVQVDVNVMANYKRFLYFGVGYRLDYGVGIMAAVRVSQAVTIGYAYEVPIMHSVSYGDTKGSHEVLIGINFTKWIKDAKKNKEQLKRIDSIAADNQALKDSLQPIKKQLDTIARDVDSLKQSREEQDKINHEREQEYKEMKEHVDSLQQMVKDSFETMAKEYRQHIKDKPTKNFPSTVDKNTKAGKGDIFRLNNVEFDNNSSYLKKPSYKELDKVVEFLKMNADKHIRILGHTDYIASDEYNQWLSERRAKRVYDYLAEKGIPEGRMEFVGFGKKLPIADNSTEEGRAQNRRVEMEITK